MGDPQATGKPTIEENRLRLLEHFSGKGPPPNDRWSALWDAGDFLPWDQGIPNPALVDVMQGRQDLVGSSPLVEEHGELRRKRAFVPGCGRGYDVLLLASLGYDAYGLEVSTTAVEKAQAWAEEHADDYPMRDETVGRGKAKFILGDFFSNEWIQQADGIDKFEFIYDYTFFCVLSPELRPAWALRLWDLLSAHQDSVIICVEFPTLKKMFFGGPPYASPSSAYVAHLGQPGKKVWYDVEGGAMVSQDGELDQGIGFRRIGHWKAARSHAMGKGTDWVSVWKRSM